MARPTTKTTIKGSVFNIAKNIDADFKAHFKVAGAEHMRKVKKSAQGNIKERTGLLKKSITVKATDTKKGAVWAGVGINKATEGLDEDGNIVRPIMYAHLVEDGFKHKNGGEVEGKGFMTKAVDSSGGVNATDKIIETSFAYAHNKALKRS